ncbi:TPA: energy-coupled thiamine transporter ThiT [Streptococcus equi subsp. zooepidemicus]|uniref:energy-coupled thiamine transporter ThiT n=1 Tax=Streptococcus equi TaxID=1336 RepID=UPI0013F60E3F|nr:energy-coupled thiamine transporter ThiT [Streptococcus equi]MCD3370721.1 energy-coupled thiamine transporter ThiT [Streptococcus equi subsp. zooepidemicus]MCD3375660.1 energy-coupled thiamine transporter ThiT [Streptococcus equi subsp. zooepidemicus]MCD3381382.1 energy-coupled thiamine transporter ThiT [Streptococcus equi subsp. zooepidemicus]MCD3408439.1 energy-coupled thiamine transporter ThiT [Streptococcus equi subsp. zooepidemicus]MCD3446551.1 energy-coupled thiamine transporter ThiT 
MSNKTTVTVLIEAAIFAALAMALSFIPDFAGWFSPSYGAIPLVLFSLRRGLRYGLLTGLIWGLLHFVLAKVYYLSLSQVIIEYILAFTSMGLAGLFSKPLANSLGTNKRSFSLLIASAAAFLAIGVRYIWHFIAGVVFWGSYAPKGTSAIWYSFTVNGTAGLLTFIVTLIALLIILPTQPQFFKPSK